MKVIKNGQGVVIGIEPFGKAEMDVLPDLKVIGTHTTGLDHIDLAEAEKRGIRVISLRGRYFLKYVTSTAEHTFGLILALIRDYKVNFDSDNRIRGQKLSDKVLGIIGYGRIGKQMEAIAKGFGMKVLTYDKLVDYENEKTLVEVLQSDIVSIHIPLEGNEGFFTKELFRQMKPTAYFVNTSREGILEKDALLWALQNGVIRGAAMDFISDKCLLEYSYTHNNLILTNHIGGNTEEDFKLTENFIINQVENYLNAI